MSTMTWHAFHHRADVLRTVVSTADERRDGILPTDVPGVSESFTDELDLISALMLRWHARLSGNIERALTEEPMDLELAVALAWRRTSEQMPGVRLILDRRRAEHAEDAVAEALERAQQREWVRLAAAAGLSSDEGPAAAHAGHRVEITARTLSHDELTPEHRADVSARCRFVERLRAALVA